MFFIVVLLTFSIGFSVIPHFDLSVESFIKAVESAQKNKKPSEKLVQYARKFTWERAAKETLKVYESLF